MLTEKVVATEQCRVLVLRASVAGRELGRSAAGCNASPGVEGLGTCTWSSSLDVLLEPCKVHVPQNPLLDAVQRHQADAACCLQVGVPIQ